MPEVLEAPKPQQECVLSLEEQIIGAKQKLLEANNALRELEKQKPALELPALTEGPRSFFNEKTSDYWVGIPLDKMDYFMATGVLSSVQPELLNYCRAIERVKILEAQKPSILKPGGGNNGGIFKGLFKK